MNDNKLQIELNKQAIETLKLEIQKLNTLLTKFFEQSEKMFKELGKRLPAWATWAMTFMGLIIGAIIGGAFNG